MEEARKRKRIYIIANLMATYCDSKYYIGYESSCIKIESIPYKTFYPDVNWTWPEIKFILDKTMSEGTRFGTCCVCLEKQKEDEVSCNICYSKLCYECWRKILETNRGVDICPLCRFTTGVPLNPSDLGDFLNNTDKRFRRGLYHYNYKGINIG